MEDGWDDFIDEDDALLEEELDTSGIDPREPTDAKPGSDDKVLMLAARYRAGLPLWHQQDNDAHGPTDEEDPQDFFDPTAEELNKEDEPQPQQPIKPKKKEGNRYRPRVSAPASARQFEMERRKMAQRHDQTLEPKHPIPPAERKQWTPEEIAHFEKLEATSSDVAS